MAQARGSSTPYGFSSDYLFFAWRRDMRAGDADPGKVSYGRILRDLQYLDIEKQVNESNMNADLRK